jgi:hypothetical protein
MLINIFVSNSDSSLNHWLWSGGACDDEFIAAINGIEEFTI